MLPDLRHGGVQHLAVHELDDRAVLVDPFLGGVLTGREDDPVVLTETLLSFYSGDLVFLKSDLAALPVLRHRFIILMEDDTTQRIAVFKINPRLLFVDGVCGMNRRAEDHKKR